MGLTDGILALVGVLVCSSVIIGTLSTAPYKKVCYGTSNGLSFTNSYERYKSLKARYKDCSYVDGNVEIVNFDCKDNMSFLRNIEEITGYLMIVNTCTDRIQLNSLRIIRGRNLWQGLDHSPQNGMESNRTRNYSLYVAYNFRQETGNGERHVDGLAYLSMPSLTEISAGSVLFLHNPRLCFVETIDWTDILSGEGAKVTFEPRGDDKKSHCGQCPANCRNGPQNLTRHCWTRQHCQIFTRVICAKQCSGRCFGRDANECCHTECAAGCKGPLDTDCLACKNFNDSGKCVPYCPQSHRYDPATKTMVPNPNVKYTYGSQCLKECPLHMMISNGACVSDCGRDHYSDAERKCTPCVTGDCPNKCPGTGDSDWVHAENLHHFVGCNVVQGSLKIQQSTFDGDPERSIAGLTVKNLMVLENVVEITDYLRVDARLEELRSLSFLRNLTIIHGRNLDKHLYALNIYGTNLEQLALNSLRQVTHGMVSIVSNKHLCFVETFNWTRLLASRDHKDAYIFDNSNATECEAGNRFCSDQCTSDGCMGPKNDQCFDCTNYRFGSKCLESCADHSNPYLTVNSNATGLECTACHEECLNSCTGAGNHECDQCRHHKEGANCVDNCSSDHFADATRTCRPCSPLCIGGCRGPDNVMGENGCRHCKHVIHLSSHGPPECLSEDAICPSDFYTISLDTPPYTKCRRCHKECISCTGPDAKECQECRNFEQDGFCVASCSEDHYADGKQCQKCHDECVECHGPMASDCVSCRLYIVYEDFGNRKSDSKFNCTDVCPEFAANKLREGNYTFCVPDAFVKPDGRKLVAIIAGTICGGVFFIGFLVVVVFILRRQVARAEEKKLRLTAKISGIVECEPLTPSSAKPDMAVLRLIKECDLRRSGIIGSGAFGTVYKGLWIPEGENVKIPVAIKVLQEGAGENSNMLEEARIMASVMHPSCLHILAVCMTAQVMLVTQLMPLGCLLDYVRKHRDNIGSKVILNWCTQIARGMSYLEERGIIHRDLAARNVLVHSPNHVKITDFGLAKLVNEDGQFLSTGGKLPIKWLALECIRNRVFTHKSDVWSFGVTVWELCTYGQRPYENVNAGDIVNLLEKGERLPQPSICTIDVYMIMIKCWMLGAESRPSFTELAEEFAKMARDPGRYLVIPNDKLMRLPSQPADSRELLRHVSLALDGPEEVITADEYVNEHAKKPPFRRGDKLRRDERQPPIDEEAAKPIVTGSESVCDARSSDSKGSSSRGPPVPRLELASAQNRLSSYEASRDSPRYSPDPCSLSYQAAFPAPRADDADGQVPLGSDGSSDSHPSVMEKKNSLAVEPLRLPLDGTDYLQPKSLVPTSYLELVDYSGADEMLQGDYNRDPHRLDAAPDERTTLLPKTSAIENPEYFQPTKTTPLLTGQIR